MIKIPLKAGHHRSASETPFTWQMAFRWRPDDGLTLNFGLVALRFFRGFVPLFLRKPIFVIFQGGGSGPPVAFPSGSAHASQEILSHIGTYPGLNQY